MIFRRHVEGTWKHSDTWQYLSGRSRCHGSWSGKWGNNGGSGTRSGYTKKGNQSIILYMNVKEGIKYDMKKWCGRRNGNRNTWRIVIDPLWIYMEDLEVFGFSRGPWLVKFYFILFSWIFLKAKVTDLNFQKWRAQPLWARIRVLEYWGTRMNENWRALVSSSLVWWGNWQQM